MMRIYIPTAGRANQQLTWRNLPASIQQRTVLVVQDKEKHLYPAYKKLVLPPNIDRINITRQWIMDQHDVKKFGPKLVMVDDDLRFATRRKDDPTKFLTATAGEVENMFAALEGALTDYAHASILQREGANRESDEIDKECTRQVRMLGYYVPIFHRIGAKFTRVPLQSDFDVTLQLIRAGYPNLVLGSWVHDQVSSNAPGGCAVYRTLDLLEQSSRMLAELHAPFVKLRVKETKGAWGGTSRIDVHIAWKEAFKGGATKTLF